MFIALLLLFKGVLMYTPFRYCGDGFIVFVKLAEA